VVPPAPTGRVSDYAGLLAPADRARLETRLAERERATGVQMVVAVFRSLEGESLDDFSIRLAERWRIGQKGLDDGVILLVFVDDRKLRLEVGYGLEPVLPDAVASRIIRDAITPQFRERRYAAGLDAAVDAVFARIETTAGRPGGHRSTSSSALWSLGFLALFAVVAIILLSEAWSGRRFVQRGGGMGGRRGGYDPPIIFFPGGRSGGGFGGGPGDGGFSGGGGSFGGGGASGDW